MLQFVATKFQKKNSRNDCGCREYSSVCRTRGQHVVSVLLAVFVIYKNVGFLARLKNLLTNDCLSQRKSRKTCGFVVSKALLKISYNASILAHADRPTKRLNVLLVVIVSGFGGQIRNYSAGWNSDYPIFLIFILLFCQNQVW